MNIGNATIDELIAKSNDVRRGERIDPVDGFAIARRLAGKQYIEHARRLAAHVADDERLGAELGIELRQKWALWTSQNPDGPDDSRHDEALRILDGIKGIEGGASLKATTDAETLGIAGGICKRKWLATGQRQTLEDSLRYYERGAEQGIEQDTGYTAINAAFILDVLASMEGGEKGGAKHTQAREWRERVRDTLLGIQDKPARAGGPPRKEVRWFYETLAEAYFGLGDYANATQHLKKAYDLGPVEPWELETTARQFAYLARLQDPLATTSEQFERSLPWGVLRAVYGDSATAGAGSLFAGKLGIGLSGGGFRASLFHIGVLAGLAERDLLRHVEVLSCVSGGSIVGAHYYLEVRKLLQEKTDADIRREDYIELIERLAREFLAGVQKNIRTRIGSNPLVNLRMMFQPGYSRTNRLGELYEKHLYARVDDDGERVLRKLIVKPKGDEKCKPKYDNWKRSNKVPILVLNATSVNTGHNWQFTASWMGEPPAFIDSQIDGNYRLRRMYYDTEAPLRYRDIRIGQAAAASSCVPGLFTPLELRKLYKNGVTVRLVDGGVHDNQGIAGLLDQNCTVLVASDASGQISSVDRPPDNPIGVLLRTTSMLQARVRTSEYREVESRRKSGRLKGLLFLHLKKDLEVEDRDWVGCDNPKQLTVEEARRGRSSLTSYGILKGVQSKIANIRTDLDSFSEVEAFALMTSGCQMVRSSIGNAIEGFRVDKRQHDWSFLGIKPALSSTKEETSGWLNQLLDVASITFLKIWKLSPLLRVISIAGGIAVALGLLWALVAWHEEPFLTPKGLAAAVAMTLLTVAAASIGLQWLVRLIQYRKTVWQILAGAGLSLVGWIGSNIHLCFFDRWFLKRGEMRESERNPS
ncbi:MAG: patatin-like phospholipase family protein [Chromatiaceae bacterium]|nr:patatin-like phospholipase family protein [Chromatiaceae bacterium]